MHLFQWIFLAFLLSGGALLNPIYAGDEPAVEQEKTDDDSDTQDADAVQQGPEEDGDHENDGHENTEEDEDS